MALISIWKDKKVHVKRGDKTADCLTTDNTWYSLIAAIERSTEKPVQSQELLFQEKITANEAKLVPLKSDDDVKRMFQEAKEVSIMVVKRIGLVPSRFEGLCVRYAQDTGEGGRGRAIARAFIYSYIRVMPAIRVLSRCPHRERG